MGLQHIAQKNLKPQEEITALTKLQVSIGQQLERIRAKLFKQTISPEKRRRIEVDKNKKEIAQSAISERLRNLTTTVQY